MHPLLRKLFACPDIVISLWTNWIADCFAPCRKMPGKRFNSSAASLAFRRARYSGG